MSAFRKILQFSNRCGYYKNILHERTNWLSLLQLQACVYTKKSTEEKLCIEKPKRPLNPFFKFMMQMRPVLITKVPGISSKEAVLWGSKHWKHLLDHQTKLQMKTEYADELHNYKKKNLIYESSLTDEQKQEIKRATLDIKTSKENRKLKAEMRKMGKPKKPMSSYLLYTQSRKDIFQSRQLKEYQEKVKSDWLKLPQNEREKFDKQAQDLMKKYKEEMKSWELKMISMQHTHLVKRTPPKKKK